MTVRELHLWEIRGAITALFPHFLQEVGYHKKLNVNHLIPAWEGMARHGHAKTLVLGGTDSPAGIFLGLIVPDLFTGELQGLEVLWYVRREHRKHSLRLLATFEADAKKQGCTTILSGAVADYKAEAMGRLYERRGYKFHGNAYEKNL